MILIYWERQIVWVCDIQLLPSEVSDVIFFVNSSWDGCALPCCRKLDLNGHTLDISVCRINSSSAKEISPVRILYHKDYILSVTDLRLVYRRRRLADTSVVYHLKKLCIFHDCSWLWVSLSETLFKKDHLPAQVSMLSCSELTLRLPKKLWIFGLT